MHKSQCSHQLELEDGVLSHPLKQSTQCHRSIISYSIQHCITPSVNYEPLQFLVDHKVQSLRGMLITDSSYSSLMLVTCWWWWLINQRQQKNFMPSLSITSHCVVGTNLREEKFAFELITVSHHTFLQTEQPGKSCPGLLPGMMPITHELIQATLQQEYSW